MLGLFRKKETPAPLPDLKRAPVSPEFLFVLQEYAGRRAGEKLALCLEGGGAKGRWQAGFMARAAEVGLLQLVDVAAGTSVGGLNALVMARYLDESPNLQKVVDVWRSIDRNEAIYLGKLPTDFWAAVRGLMAGKLNAASWLDVSPLLALVEKHLGGFTEFRLPVYTVAADYVTKRARIFGPGTKASDMALATSAVPGAFPAHLVDGVGHMDGGCSMNCPYPFLLEHEQATKIIVLYCDPDPNAVTKSSPAPSTLNTAAGALGALMQVQSDRAFSDLESIAQIRDLMKLSPVEIAHFYPSVETGTLLDFGGRPELLQQGYDDAVQFLTPEKLKALLVA